MQLSFMVFLEACGVTAITMRGIKLTKLVPSVP